MLMHGWVYRVNLHATDARALNILSLNDLKKFAAEGDVDGSGVVPDKNGRGPIREHHEISGTTGGQKASAAVEAPLTSGSRGFN
jgi:hypothetical protein